MKSLLLGIKLIILFSVLGLISVAYLFYYYSRDLPDYSQLASYSPPSVTRIYSADLKLVEEYAVEHRIFVPISNVPRSLIDAFVAAEDKNFFEHPGVDVVSIIRAAISNVSNILQRRRMEGGSTITQQVVKNFLLTSERSLERKIKEAVLSYMVSKAFTKEQILELYLNQTYLGHGAYGVAAAAEVYFNKSVEELTLPEAAFIAGLPKAPSSFNPEKNYNRAKERRDYVIIRMLEDGYITEDAAKEAISLPIKLVRRDKSETVTAHYYAERVRLEAINMIGKEQFYTGGFTIITSLKADMQNFAEQALRKGIRDYDSKKGYRSAITTVDLKDWQKNLNQIANPPGLLEYKLATVLDVTDVSAKVGLKDGSVHKLTLSDMKWTRTNLKSVKNILKKGDVVAVEAGAKNYQLRQIPAVNGAILVMNPHTGQVYAVVGGYDYDVSKFDRSFQALRQPGSLSKSFVYLAALENGILPNRIFEDGPIEISQGPGMPTWRPKNYKGDFLGHITMRTGLEKSRNLITVRVAQTIGLSKVAETIRRFGINQNPPHLYSMVLGSIETTLDKMTTAYGIIGNGGKKITPQYIEMIKDRNGKIIYRRDNRQTAGIEVRDNELENALPIIIPEMQARQITDEASSYQITSLLTGVVERGTAGAARKLGKIIAGKTGTTNDSKDTWFVGFTPRIIVGTYVGHDIPKDMGKTATGASVALPIFVEFMDKAYKDYPSLPFKVPQSVKLISINPKTGKLSNEKGAIMEAFKTTELPDDVQEQREQKDEVPTTVPNRDLSQEVY